MCVKGGPLACISSDGSIGVKAMGLYVSEGKREREGRWTGTEGNGDTVSFRSHLAGIEKGERGGWQRTEVTVLVSE